MRGGVAALLLVSLSGCQPFLWGEKVDFEVISTPTRIREAEQLRETGDPKKALPLYEEHIAARAKNPKRPADENPSFYYLFVGDTYLEMHCPTEAKRSYDRALTDGVERDLVVDRYRRLSKWFTKAQMFKESLDLLKSVRHLDEVLVDSDIDHLHKELIRREDEGPDGSAKKAPPPPACTQP